MTDAWESWPFNYWIREKKNFVTRKDHLNWNDPTTRGLDLVVDFHHNLESNTPEMDLSGDCMRWKLMENENFDIVHFIMNWEAHFASPFLGHVFKKLRHFGKFHFLFGLHYGIRIKVLVMRKEKYIWTLRAMFNL